MQQKKTQQQPAADPWGDPWLGTPTIAHVVPDWAAKPGTRPTALCGTKVTIPAGQPVVDAVQTMPNVIVCPLCECAQLLDGIPDPPSNNYEQPKLF